MSAAAFAMRAYRQVENQGIAGDKLYALGLDGILEYLRRAEAALRKPDGKDLPLKGQSLGRAYQLVEHLLAVLPDGMQEGPQLAEQPVAERLERIYTYLLARLAQANIFDDLQAIEDCRTVVTALRDSWHQGMEQAAA
ncbi:flagellar export chaperone FliS [Thiomonas arsenitoxydans]|jgi:flagellar protein FliS|uniref:flagellar export chaperone FliS n=1 Tax=Thiomonas arsenitoxydans (strain DSM 22701 / CIP 110005 / 3As) TaxID=426114 RepID=UPI001ACB487F|nr:flagellar export chaperone FliS [Thiomonas arsenitoxydans]MBN8776864.1 flagellar export chaperone FliS [Thiomonas arsenitoxydans]